MPRGQLRAWLDRISALGGVVSSAEAAVVAGGEVRFRHAAGYRLGGEALRPESGARFDAASLTKPWFATLGLVLDLAGELPLATAIGDLLPEGRVSAPLAGRSLEDLLRHRSGIPAWTALGLRLGGEREDPDAVLGLIFREPLSPPESGPYSDLGYIAWGLLVERATGTSLSDLLDSRVCAPLGLAPLGALASDPPQPVECRLDNGREVELAAAQGLSLSRQRTFHLGRPQDGNARVLGRLSAHAGIFATVEEELALAEEWLRPGRLLSPKSVAHALAGDGSYALGWKRSAPGGAVAGTMTSCAVGHAGFTGGSLWIDPERDRVELLLAHRLASRIDFDPFRREFHRLAAAIGSQDPQAPGDEPGESPSRFSSKKLE